MPRRARAPGAKVNADQRLAYDRWVTAGRPGDKHPRSLLELLRRERDLDLPEADDDLNDTNDFEVEGR